MATAWGKRANAADFNGDAGKICEAAIRTVCRSHRQLHETSAYEIRNLC